MDNYGRKAGEKFIGGVVATIITNKKQMKLQSFIATLKEIVGGTPTEFGAKALLAMIAALWQNLEVIGMSLFGYGVLLLVDAIMGAALAKRQGRGFSFSHFTFGPGKKLALTAGMLLCTSFVDQLLPNANWIPDSPLFYGAAAFISVSQLLDVAKKYGTLSGSKVANWIEAKLGSFVKL
jgi:hypothetical protein